MEGRRKMQAGSSRSARHLLCLLVVANIAACAAFASCASLATPLAQRRRLGAAQPRRARMSSAAPKDGAGRLPPKPLAKYSTEPVGTNLPKADSAKYVLLVSCLCQSTFCLCLCKVCLACVLLVPKLMRAPHPWGVCLWGVGRVQPRGTVASMKELFCAHAQAVCSQTSNPVN